MWPTTVKKRNESEGRQTINCGFEIDYAYGGAWRRVWAGTPVPQRVGMTLRFHCVEITHKFALCSYLMFEPKFEGDFALDVM